VLLRIRRQKFSVLFAIALSLVRVEGALVSKEDKNLIAAAFSQKTPESFILKPGDPKSVVVVKNWAKYVLTEVGRKQVRFTDEGAQEITKVLADAADKIPADADVENGKTADENLKKLIAAQIALAKKNGDFGNQSEITKEVVQMSLKSLCPLWPFCK
jgi:hypothetical protein